jgi:hypothetical protein
MRSIALVIALAAVASCTRTPTAPETPTPPPVVIPPTPRALLQPVGVFLFTGCTVQGTCAFNAVLVNNGPGCAIRVEGTTRIFDATGLQLGAPYKWTLPASQIVQPAERVPYVVNFVPFDQALRAQSYSTDPLWIDTSCR